jgi:hypothetical protein
MQALINQVVGLSGAADAVQLLEVLKKAEGTFSSQQGALPAALQALDAQQHSLGYAFFL